jgi:hypothetical protein
MDANGEAFNQRRGEAEARRNAEAKTNQPQMNADERR